MRAALYNRSVAALSFSEARTCVLERVQPVQTASEAVGLSSASGRILAEPILADRDYPPVPRSVRDGFAVRAADAPRWTIAGEVRAGEAYQGSIRPGEAIEIMTGAPIPEGADAVIMVEHVRRDGLTIDLDRPVAPGDFINPKGSEARAGSIVVERGRRLGFAEIAMAATVGRASVEVYRKPRVAVLATGDEVVEVDETPRDYQVRNSNSFSIAAQVERAGAVAEILPVARDTVESTRALIERGLDADLLLLAGGVSAGKYDVVETVFAELGADFYFDRVRIQPGQPVVFGRVRERFFFGLPGNPGSTMVTFELFARAALERLSGVPHPALPLVWAPLAAPFRHRTGLTRFLPAVLGDDGRLTPLASKGSSDVPALARANAFLVADEDRESWAEGDMIRVLLK